MLRTPVEVTPIQLLPDCVRLRNCFVPQARSVAAIIVEIAYRPGRRSQRECVCRVVNAPFRRFEAPCSDDDVERAPVLQVGNSVNADRDGVSAGARLEFAVPVPGDVRAVGRLCTRRRSTRRCSDRPPTTFAAPAGNVRFFGLVPALELVAIEYGLAGPRRSDQMSKPLVPERPGTWLRSALVP